MTPKISTKICRRRLGILWLVGGLSLFLLFVFQSIGGKYGGKVEEAWAWFLPTIMPTLTLVLGVLVLEGDLTSGKDDQTERFVFYIAFVLSTIYLVLVGMTPLVQPLIGGPPLELMTRSSLWLGPLQGLVAAALGVFFVRH